MKDNKVEINHYELTVPLILGLLGRVFFFAGNISTAIALLALLIAQQPSYQMYEYISYLENAIYLMPFSLGVAFLYRIVRYYSGYRNVNADNIKQSWFRLFLVLLGFLVIWQIDIINFEYQSCIKMLLLYFPVWILSFLYAVAKFKDHKLAVPVFKKQK